jgi:hypothetical protein
VLLAMSLGPLKIAATGLIAVGLIAVATTGVIAQQGKPAPDGKKAAEPSTAEVFRSAIAQWERAERLRQADTQRTAAIGQQIDRAVEAIHAGKTDEALRSLERARSISRESARNDDRPSAVPLAPREHLEDVTRPASPAAVPPAALPAPIMPGPLNYRGSGPGRKLQPPTALPTPAPSPNPSPSPNPNPSPNPKATSLVTPQPQPPLVPNDSSQELITEYRSAQEAFRRVEQLHRQAAISAAELSAGRDRLDRALNRIESRADIYRDQLELLQVQLKRQQAEVDRVKGQRDLAAAQVAAHERLRKKGLVSNEEIEKSEGELVIANAGLRAAEADREIIELRIRQFERRQASVVQFLQSVPKPPASDSAVPKR